MHHVTSETQDNIQIEADHISQWAASKKLEINMAKSKTMCISRSAVKPSPPPVILGGHVLEEVSSLRILGIVFQSDTRWTLHLEALILKCQRSLGLVRKVWAAQCPSSIVWLAYRGYVFSLISFSWPLICDISKMDHRKLERFHKIAQRWAFRKVSSTLLEDLDKICRRLIRKIAVNESAHPLAGFFEVRNLDRRLRHQRQLLPLRINKQFFLNSFVRYSKLS